MRVLCVLLLTAGIVILEVCFEHDVQHYMLLECVRTSEVHVLLSQYAYACISGACSIVQCWHCHTQLQPMLYRADQAKSTLWHYEIINVRT
jgi:hypothetical protein